MKLTTKLHKLQREIERESSFTQAFIFPCKKSGKALSSEKNISCDNCNIINDCIEYFASQPNRFTKKISPYNEWLKATNKTKFKAKK